MCAVTSKRNVLNDAISQKMANTRFFALPIGCSVSERTIVCFFIKRFLWPMTVQMGGGKLGARAIISVLHISVGTRRRFVSFQMSIPYFQYHCCYKTELIVTLCTIADPKIIKKKEPEYFLLLLCIPFFKQ